MMKRIMAIFLLVCGVVFCVTGVFVYFHVSNLLNNGKTAQAIIVSIKVEKTGDADKHNVLVKYTVDGVEYLNELGSHASGMQVGQSVEIKYLPENPNIILYAKSPYFGVWIFVFFGVGSIFTAYVISRKQID